MNLLNPLEPLKTGEDSAMTESESKGRKLKPKVTNQDHGVTRLVYNDINIDVDGDEDDDKTSFNRPSIHS